MNQRQAIIDRYLADRSPAHRDALIEAHLYLCKRGARKFRRPESDPADLEQVAAIGLIKAANAYVAERSTPFEPYAWIVIVGELMHYVRDSETAIRVPRALRALDRRYVAAWETLAARNQAEPTPRQLAFALDVGLPVVEQLQIARRGRFCELESVAAAPGGLTIDERLTLLDALDTLPQRERTIVLGTFGAGLSQAEVAHLLGLSQSQISKLLARALGKLSQQVA